MLYVVPFEIGSHTGYISSDNKGYIHTLHKFCQKSIKQKKFMQNMSAIVTLSSYYLFNCRNNDNWGEMDPILAPFPNQWYEQYVLYIFTQEETTVIWPAGRFAKIQWKLH